ncbi:MAG: hypothetical protein SCALA701_05480 [Candidatus Scalindua sp.]|nr:MAG: hypothetical protein SCALA701_05480 [Candidatus Scalindua sp.]
MIKGVEIATGTAIITAWIIYLQLFFKHIVYFDNLSSMIGTVFHDDNYTYGKWFMKVK